LILNYLLFLFITANYTCIRLEFVYIARHFAW